MYLHGLAGTCVLARLDPESFSKGGARFVTTNEESSGVVDIGHIKAGWFRASVQAHVDADDPELVEGGQIVAIRVPR